MQIGMIGIGRMGGDMVRRLLGKGHQCVVYGRRPEAVAPLVAEGAVGTTTYADFVARLEKPRVVWLMVPAATVDAVLAEVVPLLAAGDIVVDGGNSRYHDAIRRSGALRERGLHVLDVGTSGGVWGRERGYCLMIGGETEPVLHLEPLFRDLAPGRGEVAATPGRPTESSAEQGYLHCGPNGAGHFVKMIHNGIEYGMMAAYAEGFNILRHAGIGKADHAQDAETTPLQQPEHYQYDFNLADIAELWRRGSVIPSWLLDLCARALADSPDLAGFSGQVSDSGEGRWTISAAIDEGVPVPVLSAALFQRFSSRGQADFADQLLSALRWQFGGHGEPPSTGR
jgi:6-phosphogluconate dehydrogenase